MGRQCNVAKARLNQVGEVEQPVFPLILPPLFIEADQRLRQDWRGSMSPRYRLSRWSSSSPPFSISESLRRLLAIKPALFPGGRDGKLGVVPVPVVHVRFGKLRAAQGVPAVGVQRTHPVARDW